MNRNEEINSNSLPQLERRRYRHSYTKRHMTTGNVGEIIPFYTNILVNPGDTFNIKCKILLRLTTSLYATMDNLYADVYFFKDDYINIWNDYKKWLGENENGQWTQTTEYNVPKGTVKTYNHEGGYFFTGNIADHMNIISPAQAGGSASDTHTFTYCRLGITAYQHIWNQYFRNENTTPPVILNKTSNTIEYSTTDSNGYVLAGGGECLKASKFNDYFTSLLPQPQKGNAVEMPLGTSAEVIGESGKAITFTYLNNSNTTRYGNIYTKPSDETESGTYLTATGATTTNLINGATGINGLNMITPGSMFTGANIGLSDKSGTSGIIADLTNATAATINALRLAATTQQILERNALYGTRLPEVMRGRWGVVISADEAHIPEYIGGQRIPLNMMTVLNTTGTTDNVQGSTAGYSLTTDVQDIGTKSFTQHAVLMGLIVVRQDHTYSQGIPNQYLKSSFYDFFQPEYANLGMQPVYQEEIYAANGTGTGTVLGYKPAWQEYRRELNEITGYLRPSLDGGLAPWTYGDDYNSAPVLGKAFMEETPDYVDRSLVYPHTTAPQLLIDTNVIINKRSEVPTYGIPGIDRL